MKIIQLLPELNEGGVERGVVELSRELVKRGFQSVVISKGGKQVEQLIQDGGIHSSIDICSKNILTAPYRIWKLYKALKMIKPDILHVRSRVPAWMIFFANSTLKIPVVSTVHGFNSVSFYSSIMTKADQIICSSAFLIEHIIKNFNADQSKIHLIPRGIDFNYFNTEEVDHDFIKQIKQNYHISTERIIINVARITHWKDQATIIRAFLIAKKTMQDLKLILIGGVDPKRESYYKSLISMIENSPYKEDIIFTGSQKKIKEFYSIAHLTISSSNKPETFGRANVEGLAMGKPLLATRLGATIDYIIEGKTGFFFQTGNHVELAHLIQQSFNYSFNNEKIMKFAEKNFSLTQMVEKTICVYKMMVK